MPMIDPNILLSIMQGVQGGTPLNTAQGVSEQMLPRMNNFFGGMNPDRLSSLTTQLGEFAPTWEQGDHWKLRDAFGRPGHMGGLGGMGGMRHMFRPGGGGMGGMGMGGGGQDGASPGTAPTTGGMMPGAGHGMGLRGGRGK
jgi:hypothetical protein